jgi:aspartyl/asparaginyl beta-hydroxylase (cupin superfamily)
MTQEASPNETAADQAAARKDFGTALRLLEEAVAETPSRIESWMKLAALRRATGNPRAALAALSGALRIAPLDYPALLAKASLLEQIGKEQASGEAYGHALAQRPSPDKMPAAMQGATEHAERRYAAFQAGLLARLRPHGAVDELSAAERRRVERFCTNVARTTSVYHSDPSHFHFPGLAEREFHDRETFPWLDQLEAATPAITEDFHRVMGAERAELVPYIQYPAEVPLRQWAALNHSSDWRAIHLVKNGARVDANARHCPATMALLEKFDQPVVGGCSPNAMFSLLAPGAHIPPHTGVANTRLVCHLPLIVPAGCWFRVGAETREWQVGEAWVFDDTIEHEAKNPTDSLRVILIVDTWHPDLSPAERTAVAGIMETSEIDLGAESL